MVTNQRTERNKFLVKYLSPSLPVVEKISPELFTDGYGRLETKVINKDNLAYALVDLQHEIVFSKNPIAFDYETTGLDQHRDHILLTAIYTGKELEDGTKVIYVINETDPSIKDAMITSIYPLLKERTIIAHNAKFDYNMLLANRGDYWDNIYDTMIADQVLFQNFGLKNRLPDVIQRHLKLDVAFMDKTIGASFVGMRPVNTRFTESQIMYAAEDVCYLHDVKERQEVKIKEHNLQHRIYNIEMPLIKVLGKGETRGIQFNKDKWKEILKESKAKKYEAELELDECVRLLADARLKGEDRLLLKGGKYTRKRNKIENVEQGGLFGESKTVKVKPKKGANINYKSPDEILDLFARLNLTLPTKEKHPLIPILDKKGKLVKKRGRTLEGAIVQTEKFETGKPELIEFLIDNPEHVAEDFIFKLINYKKYATRVDNFGLKFLDKVNPITNRMHTIYRQCNTVTGRLQSGGGTRQPDRFNSQNVPRDGGFRHCFEATDGYEMVICDLSGAEVVIICDKANDEQLYEWAVKQDDAHSPIVTRAWKAVFLFRAGKLGGLWNNFDEYEKMDKLHGTDKIIQSLLSMDDEVVEDATYHSIKFEVSKKVNKPYRQAGKNGTFGTIYGMHYKKCSKTYNGTDMELKAAGIVAPPVNVTPEEGKVILYTIKKTIPASFKYVESCVEKVLGKAGNSFAKRKLGDPYLIINDRTNTKIWFEPVSTAKKYGGELGWKEINDVEGQCRNCTIQGTQAEILKEAMVIIDKTIVEQDLDAHFLIQVHDELVYEYRPETQVDISTTGKPHLIPFADYVKLAMTETANLYLKNVTMGAEHEISPYWKK